MNVHVFQHVPFEGPAGLTEWFSEVGAEVRRVRLFDGEALPELAETDWLVVMGGPMSANDEEKFPWMAGEKRFVAQAVAAGKTVLGICLGAQLIASALGARVYPNPEREIGWFPVTRTADPARVPLARALPERIEAFHWHGETFDLPPGAVRLARSAACENQAFAVGDRVMGVQFHLETTMEGARALLENCAEDLRPGAFVQNADTIPAGERRFEALRFALRNLLEVLRRGG